MKTIKRITGILFALVLLAMGVGLYFLKVVEDDLTGNKIIGFSVLVLVFVVMPLFLYFRLKGKNLRDYTLTQDNIQRWREELDGKEKKKPRKPDRPTRPSKN